MVSQKIKSAINDKLRLAIINSLGYGVTQEDIAQKLGVSRVVVNAVLRERSPLGIDKAAEMLSIMGFYIGVEVSFNE